MLNAQQALSEIVGPMSRYEGLALMAQTMYYTGSNSALAVEAGNKALEILEKTCPDQIEFALAKSIVGYAYLFNGDGVKSVQLLTSAIELFEKNKRQNTWLSSLTYAYRGGAYIALKNGDAAIMDIGKSVEFYNDKEFDLPLLQHFILTSGMAVYVYTACGLYDDAILFGKTLLENCDVMSMSYIFEYGNTLQNIGAAYIMKKDIKNGLEYLEKAKAHYDEHGYTETDSYRMLIRNLTQLKNN